jgi:glycosyltransferase involved in cell wall biosynthesis
MRILVFTSLYPNNVWPNHGIFINERMTRFAALEGCEVKVVAPVPYFPPFRINWRWKFSNVAPMEIRDGIEVYHPRYYMIPKVGMTLYGLMMFMSVFRTVRKVRGNFDFDLIDAHFVYPDGFAAVLMGKYFKKPVVVSARGSDINLYRSFPLIRWLLRHVLAKANKIIAVSEALKQAMIQLDVPEGKISFIPNGVDGKKFYPIPKPEARRELGLSNRRTILSVGNLNPNKGFDLLIRSFQVLVGRFGYSDLQLTIVGDGLIREDLQRLVSDLKLQDLVCLAGAVPHEKLRLWYSAADLFCLASAREGWPNVILESLVCGTPVVATSVGGIPEIIGSDKVGLLVDRNEVALAAAIDRALNKDWSEDALVAYARLHTWDRTARDVLQVFQSVLDTNNFQDDSRCCSQAIVVSRSTRRR